MGSRRTRTAGHHVLRDPPRLEGAVLAFGTGREGGDRRARRSPPWWDCGFRAGYRMSIPPDGSEARALQVSCGRGCGRTRWPAADAVEDGCPTGTDGEPERASSPASGTSSRTPTSPSSSSPTRISHHRPGPSKNVMLPSGAQRRFRKTPTGEVPRTYLPIRRLDKGTKKGRGGNDDPR